MGKDELPTRRAACSSLPDGPVADERAAFEASFPNFDLGEAQDAWGRPKYAHEHVESIWFGWKARAALSAVSLPDGGAAERTLKAPADTRNEGYPSDWKRVELMVSPTGELHSIGGDNTSPPGVEAYLPGFERIKKFWVRAALAAPSAQPPVPEGCTPADAKMLRDANHGLILEITRLRDALRPFAVLARPALSSATVKYMVKDDPERQHFETALMHRAFNRAADLLRSDYEVDESPLPSAQPSGAPEVQPERPKARAVTRDQFIAWANEQRLPTTIWESEAGPYFADQSTDAAWRALQHFCDTTKDKP